MGAEQPPSEGKPIARTRALIDWLPLGTDMARRHRKMEPVSLDLRYQTSVGAVSPDGIKNSWVTFINLADGLSMQNRKLFRCNRVYSVDSVDHRISSAVAMGTVKIEVVPLPCTYSILNSLARAERAWDEMNDQITDALDFEESESAKETKARWSDFKMKMITSQSTYQAGGTDINPIGESDNTIGAPGAQGATMVCETNQVDAAGKHMEFLTSGEKIVSKFQTPEGEFDGSTGYDEFYMSCIGDHNGAAGNRLSVSALLSYLDTRVDPNVVSQEPGLSDVDTDPLVNLFTNLDTFEQIADDLVNDGNRAPYPDNDEWFMTNVDDQSWLPPSVGSTSISTTSSPSSIRTTGGFLAPHGWVMLIMTPSAESVAAGGSIETTFHMTPGDYRGVASDHVGDF